MNFLDLDAIKFDAQDAEQNAKLERMAMNFLDLDAIKFDAQDAEQNAKLEREAMSTFLAKNPQAFVGTSLGAWIDAADKAGVAHVSAEKIYTIEREAIMMLGGGEPTEDHRRQWEELQAALAKVPETHMVRWDPCADLSVKLAMGNGQNCVDMASFVNERRKLDPGDLRAYDIIYEFPLERVDVWSRPWVQPMMFEDYPVEFRVFVCESEVIGVANYYFQRDLPGSSAILDYAMQAKAMSEHLLSPLLSQGQFAWMPNYERAGMAGGEGRIHATLDFMVSADGELLLLEAGPPFGAGAHPCAFMGQNISGIALANGREPMTMPQAKPEHNYRAIAQR